jgi:hypothetical protein
MPAQTDTNGDCFWFRDGMQYRYRNINHR